MEPIIVIVGFLGAGKTTLLKNLANSFLSQDQNPFIILNDYQNASLDSQQFLSFLDKNQIAPINGNCICCSGINQLRDTVNTIPKRRNGVTLIEANGTTDACTLMEFLGVGIKDQFLPPVQISVVDCRNWQKRASHNFLEAEQIKVSSIVVLNYADRVNPDRLKLLQEDISRVNPAAILKTWDELDSLPLLNLNPPKANEGSVNHAKSHFSSCSVALPAKMSSNALNTIIKEIPKHVLRVKASTKLDNDDFYSFIERGPTNEVNKRTFTGELVSGPVILTVGPGSDPLKIESIVNEAIAKFPI